MTGLANGASIFEREIPSKVSGQKTYRTVKIHHVQTLTEPERSQVLEATCAILSGYSLYRQKRFTRALSELFDYMQSQYGDFSFHAPDAAQQIRTYLHTAFRSKRRRFLVEHDQWVALRALLYKLIHARAIPPLDLPPLSKQAPKLAKHTRHTKTVIDKLALPSDTAACLSAPGSSDAQFWRTLHSASSDLFAAIVAAAKTEAQQAINEFHYGQTLIAQNDQKALMKCINSEQLLDTGHIAPNGQAFSIFSPSHPNGFSNILTAAHLTNANLLYDRGFPGAHHAYEQPGGLLACQRHLGLTIDAALAFFVVILTETGFNVDAIHAARAGLPDSGMPLRMPVDDDALTRINVTKPRAKRYLNSISGDSPFNAAQAFQALFEMTSAWRTAYSRDELWLYPGDRKNNAPSLISTTALKWAWGRFLDRHPSILWRLSERISRKDIRTLGGIVRWFDSGGNMTEAARYLNNSAAVAIKNYIPPELQEAYYTFQIRRFQNLLIVAAVIDDKALLQHTLRYDSMEQLNAALDQIMDDPALHHSTLLRDLYQSKVDLSPDSLRYTFLCNENNIAMLYCLTQALSAIKREYPQIDLTKNYQGFQPAFWTSLWFAVADRLENTADRNLKRMYAKGLKLAESPNLFTFNCLDTLLNEC